MELERFIEETSKGIIPVSELTAIAADRAAYGDDVIAAFKTQIELRSTTAQTVLSEAEKAGRDTLLASEQRSYDASIRERDSLLSLQRAVEQRTEQRNHVPATQTGHETRTVDVADAPAVLSKDMRCVDWLQKRGGYAFQGERGVEQMRAGRVIAALATGDKRGLSDLERRALAEGVDTTGGFAVPDVLGAQIIDAVLNRMVARAAGATVVPMSAETVNLARVAQPGIFEPGSPQGAGAQWKLENADIVEGTLELERVQLKAKTLPMLLTMSVELSEDATGLDAAIERAMSGQIAVEFDRVALNGSGTPPEPTGILNQSGVTVDATPVTIAGGDYDFLVDALGTLWTANHEANAIVYSPAVAVALAKLKSTVDAQPLRRPEALANLPTLRSNQATANQVFVADWSQLLIGVRTGFRLEVSRVAGDAFGKLQIAIRAYLRGDIAVSHPEAFVVLTNVS